MKAIKIMLITLLIIALSGCGTSDNVTEMNPLDPVEREEKDENDEGYTEVEVEENNAEDNATTESTKETDSDETKTEESDSADMDDETVDEEENALSGNENNEEVILEADEYQVLDLSELEDENNYETGLVFIVQEEDIWRVVDRVGQVYRVSTTNESVSQGIVNINATVTINDEGNAKVSLSRDYDKYDNDFVLQVKTDVEEEFAIGLLDMQLLAPETSKIDSYTLNSVSSEKLGKGIRIITMNYNVVPSSGATKWGSNQADLKNIMYTFTAYGYETTWILPVKAPLYKSVVASSEVVETVEPSEPVEDIAADDTIESNENDEGNEEPSSTTFTANEFQRLLADINGKIYYSEKELLPQTDLLVGTNSYEHTIRLYEYDSNSGNTRQIAKGEKNGNYSLIKVFENKLFLITMDESPSASWVLTGLSYVNLDDLSYRSIYKGQIAKGINITDKAYMFTNDNLVEIDLVNASIRIASNLPEHLEFDINSVKVLGLEDNLLSVEISYETKSVTYTIHVISGETTEIDSFLF